MRKEVKGEILSEYKILFYTTDRGDSPVDEFLDSLTRPMKAKVEAYMALL